MAILNKERFPYIRTQMPGVNSQSPSMTFNTDTILWTLRDFDDGFDYFYIELFCGNAFDHYDIKSLVPEDILQKIINDEKTFLYLCNSHEAFTEVLINPLYETLVLREKIPADKIIVCNEAADLYLTAKECADRHVMGCFKTEWVLVFEGTTSLDSHNHDLLDFTLDVDSKYDKRFLCFNRRWRSHRPLVVALLKAYDLLDKGYVSLGPCDDKHDWKEFYPFMKFQHSQNSRVSEILESIESDMLQLGPLYLDFPDLTINLPDIEDVSKPYYQNSLVSIVNETNFFTDTLYNSSRFLSEKIFKPIAFGHPFVLVTVPKSLELLRSLGYKTFHPYIDESYDYENDDYKRLFMILDQVKKICEYNDEQVIEFINNVKPIVKHNQEVLMAKSKKSRDGTDHSVMQRNFLYKTS
jgi:hypothetical protein